MKKNIELSDAALSTVNGGYFKPLPLVKELVKRLKGIKPEWLLKSSRR